MSAFRPSSFKRYVRCIRLSFAILRHSIIAHRLWDLVSTGGSFQSGPTASPPGPGLAVPSVLGSRLLLNLRDAYYKPYGVETLTTHTLELPIVNRSAKGTRAGSMDTRWALYPSQVRQSYTNTFHQLDACFAQDTRVDIAPATSTNTSTTVYAKPMVE